MIILNNLTKNGTCDSVTAMSENGIIVITMEFEQKTMLNVKNNISKESMTSHMIGVIDAGIQFNFQAYNNKIRVSKQGEKVYRGIK